MSMTACDPSFSLADIKCIGLRRLCLNSVLVALSSGIVLYGTPLDIFERKEVGLAFSSHGLCLCGVHLPPVLLMLGDA